MPANQPGFPGDFETYSDAVLFEFVDVAVPLPPGTPATERVGRPSKDELAKFRQWASESADSQLQSFEDNASSGDGARS
jgi:hypothetical protein